MMCWNLKRTLGRFRQNNSGNFGVIFAIVSPLLFGLAGGLVDFMAYMNQQSEMQNIADSAALAAAKEGSLKGWTSEIAISVAEQFALSRTSKFSGGQYVAKATAEQSSKTVHVTLELDHHPYFIMGYFKASPQIRVTSSATVSGEMNTCVIGLDNKRDATISLSGSATLTAPECAVYSNSTSPKGLASTGAAYMKSAYNCSAGGADGAAKNYSTMPTLDCPPIPDPLQDRTKPVSSGCDDTNRVVSGISKDLNPGIYCGGIYIDKNAEVKFAPGVYVIKDGDLFSKNGGKATGEGVTFYFTGEGSKFNFDATTEVSFSAPEAGPTAGILFYQDQAMVAPVAYEISSKVASILLGTIYLPNGIFKVHAKNKVGEKSAYTVIVAKEIDVAASSDLVINADYSSTPVPVPPGLGPNKDIRLVR